MPREFNRMDRVSTNIQKELAAIFQKDYMSPEFGLLTIQTVKVSKDLRHAKVYVTAYNAATPINEILVRLRDDSGHIRHQLGQQIRMKYTPDLRFIYDESVAYADKIATLLSEN